MKRFVFIAISAFILTSCLKDKTQEVHYEAENVIIIVIDGPRYSETWGYPGKIYIPHQSALKEEGVFYHSFFNDGQTSTNPGHTAIMTGAYENINNNGLEYPTRPSIFQLWREAHEKHMNKAWIVTSKDKLAVLANCKDPDWQNNYVPATNCGIGGGGVGSGYRHDSLTLQAVFSTMNTHHPNMMLVNFREPDFSGHQGDWGAYIDGITSTDAYVKAIWDYIQNDPVYKDKTALFVTNDHGRHLSGVLNSFAGHGDDCDGCRHISLLALGPDFQKGVDVFDRHEMRDISASINQLMHIPMENTKGEVLTDLFKK